MRIAERKRAQKKQTGKSTRLLLPKVVLCVLLALLVSLAANSVRLYQKKQANDIKKQQLTAELASEEARAEELSDYEEYVGTDEYIEQVAKDRLGLAYPDEKLFRPSE